MAGSRASIGMRSRAAALLASAFLMLAPPARAAARCPPTVGDLVDAGWKAYRADSIALAAARFQRADHLCPEGLDARVGLGYAWLRLGVPARAESLLSRVVSADSGYTDAWAGLMYAARRCGHDSLAVRAARRVLRVTPGDTDAKAVLDALSPGWDARPRALATRPAHLVAQARTHGESFEVPARGGWKTFYVKGVNLGVALPGKFPAEFPTDSAVYAGWLERIAGMNANAVRAYTILPPAFYRALAAWNAAHPEHALWLIHGVWAELPNERRLRRSELDGRVPPGDARRARRDRTATRTSRDVPDTRAATTTPTCHAGRSPTSSVASGSRFRWRRSKRDLTARAASKADSCA